MEVVVDAVKDSWVRAHETTRSQEPTREVCAQHVMRIVWHAVALPRQWCTGCVERGERIERVLESELRAGAHHAYCEMRACSYTRLHGLTTTSMRRSTLAVDSWSGDACTAELVREHERRGLARLFHPCKW